MAFSKFFALSLIHLSHSFDHNTLGPTTTTFLCMGAYFSKICNRLYYEIYQIFCFYKTMGLLGLEISDISFEGIKIQMFHLPKLKQKVVWIRWILMPSMPIKDPCWSSLTLIVLRTRYSPKCQGLQSINSSKLPYEHCSAFGPVI